MPGDRLAAYWGKMYYEAHGVQYEFTPVDGVMLHRTLKACGDKSAYAWEIHRYHEKDWDWSGVINGGYSVKLFLHMHQGLHLEYHKKKERELRRKQREIDMLDEVADSSVVVSLVERLGKRKSGG